MNLYESLIKNVGIGKEPLVRQWIKDNTKVGDETWKYIIYKDGKLSYSFLDLYVEEELPEYIDFENVKYFNLTNMTKTHKPRLNPIQLPKFFEYMDITSFDLTNTTLKLSPQGAKKICISDCLCKNTVIDAPSANLLLYSIDGFVEGISSKNATIIRLTDRDMAKLISKLEGDIDGNVREIFKKFPKVERIISTSHSMSKARGKWILD